LISFVREIFNNLIIINSHFHQYSSGALAPANLPGLQSNLLSDNACIGPSNISDRTNDKITLHKSGRMLIVSVYVFQQTN